MHNTLPTPEVLWRTITRSRRFFLISGPCVIESEQSCLQIARSLQKTCLSLQIPYLFKASFDKANRSSGTSFRGPGLAEGLKILARVRTKLNVPVVTDIHTEEQAAVAGEVCDVLQIPAFLCRQTDLIQAAVRTGRIVNIKKGQFLAPEDMSNVAKKAVSAGVRHLLLCERGTSFGYHTLVNDFRAIPIMRQTGFPVVFDATHSVQQPGGLGDRTGGQRQFAPLLAQCAIAAGANGLFIETHPNPDKSPSDGPNMVPLREMPSLLRRLAAIQDALNS